MVIKNKATFKNKRKEAYPLLAGGINNDGAAVVNGAAVPVRNSAGVNGINGTAVVANQVLTGVNLPATSATVTNAVDLVVPVTGVFATKITPTIVAGVITGFVLS